jgi:predicted ArsR family transcriptional regulator
VYDLVTRLLDERGVISSGDAQQATGLDAAGVRSHLKRLVDEGRAVTEGQRRGAKYRRVDG